MQRLQQRKYPLAVYQKVIVLVADLIEIGFSDSYMEDVKNLMIENISKMDAPVILDNDVFFIKDKERRQRIKNIIDEINLVIFAQDKQMKQKTIGEILSGEKWIEELDKYTASDNYNSFMDISIFAKADAKQWIKVIMEAQVEDIDMFRHWLDSHFPSNVIRENAKIDLPVIKEIIDGINTEKENDLIKKANLLWLKEQMGFPTIMYLSRSKVGSFWENKNRKKSLVSSIKSNLSLSLNPELSIETEFKKEDKIEIPRVKGSEEWPPYKSLEIALSMEKQLKKNNQIGTVNDLINKNLTYPCYKLKGKLFLDEEREEMLYGDIKGHGVNGILVLEDIDKKILVNISYENIAGMSFRNEHWEVWESGAMHFFRDVRSRGYDLIGLFTYEGESDQYFADCGVLYFASMHSRSYYSDNEIKNTIYNEYI